MSNKNKTTLGRITYSISVILLCILLYFAYQHYQKSNFNDFIRSEAKLYTSEFKRDDAVKYSNQRSYQIISNEYNDAMFYKTVKVEKNQPYKVTCMVKTKNVIAKEETAGVGARNFN